MRSKITIAVLGLLLGAFLAAPATAQEEKEWGYNKGFYFRTSNFELKLSTRTQFRYTYSMYDDLSATDDHGAFSIPRARLRLDGFAFYPWLKYKVQYDFSGQLYTTSTSIEIPGNFTCDPTGTEPCVEPSQKVSLRTRTGPDLRDLYFDITRNPWASVRVGQFKVPFGIQELTSSGDQEFVDRSIASVAFAPSRDQGVMIYGSSFGKAFGYEAGMFNGNGRNFNVNDNTGYMYAVRVHWDPNGEYKLAESAVDNPDKLNWTVGAAYLMTETQASLAKGVEKLGQDSLEGFFGLKYKRLFVLADYYARTQEQAAAAPDVDSTGILGQVGFFIVPAKIEVAARYSQNDPNTDSSGDKQTESRIGFGYYFSKHDLKFQADYGQLKNEASATDEKTDVFRAQLQVVF